jgi:DNA-binding transcriptional MerR regulator
MSLVRSIPLPAIPADVSPEGLTIGQAAEALGLPTETLRYYDRAGLMLDPTPRDAAGKRRYQQADLDWLGGLVMLRETGMSIADIRRVAEISRSPGTEAERLAVFERHRARVLDDLDRMQRHLAAIDRKIATYRAIVNEGSDHE